MLALLAVRATPARADEAPAPNDPGHSTAAPSSAPHDSTPPASNEKDSSDRHDRAKRPEPGDARGLESKPAVTAEDVGLFVPRAILFVPARVLGFVFAPLRAGMQAVEKHHVIDRVIDILYNDDRTAAIIPLISLSTFFGAQIGIKAFHDNLGGTGVHGMVKASWGADREQVYEAQFSIHDFKKTPLFIESTTSFESHPSLRFYGFGGDAKEIFGVHLDPRAATSLSFYHHQRFRQLLAVGATFGKEKAVEVTVAARGRLKRHDFGAGRGLTNGDRSLEDAYDTSKVPGYQFGATTGEVEGFVSLDLRDETKKTAHRLHVEAFGGGALPVSYYQFAHFGAEVAGVIDVYHRDRLFVLRVATEDVVGGDGRIPFAEMPYLGGAHWLRGYDLFRFRDEKTLTGTFEYRYPIHENIAGSFFVDVGEVHREFQDLFTDPHMHVGGGGGLIFHSGGKPILTLDVAGGEGMQIYLTTDPLSAFAERDSEL